MERLANDWEKSYPTPKRVMDVLLAVLGILTMLPLLGLVALSVKLDSPGPIIYRQARMGRNGRVFVMLKFRTMFNNAEEGGSRWASKDDWRVTRVGRFLRRFRIDELLQLWNVVKGEMSLVGPRPERPDLTRQFNALIPGFIDRLRVDQGITGWAQVNGGYDLNPAKKLILDLEYISRQSMLFDIYILLKTLLVVITGTGAR